MDLSSRHRQPELMDDPSLDHAAHRRVLAVLRRINWWSRTDAAVWKAVATVAAEAGRTPPEPLTILDIASGGGDLAMRLAKRGRSAGMALHIDGCDISPTAVAYANEQATNSCLENVRFYVGDALAQPFPRPQYDIVMCALFLHHLGPQDAVRLLHAMKSGCRKLLLVDDLRRTTCGYWLAWLGCRMLTRCHVVHVDGPRSVENAFTPREAVTIADEAGLQGATLRTHWPQRFLLSWRPGQGTGDA